MCVVVAQLTHAMNGRGFVKPFPANRAKLALVLSRLRPAVRHWIPYNAGRDTGTGSHHRRNASLVHDEVAH